MSTLHKPFTPEILRTYCQPVFRVLDHGDPIHSVECLTRGALGTPFEDAGYLFEWARSHRCEVNADLTSARKALHAVTGLRQRTNVALNFHAATLGANASVWTAILEFATAALIVPSRIIIEVLEHNPMGRDRFLLHNLEALREAGCQIALDDYGSASAHLQMLIDVRPDYLKLDRHLVSGVATDRFRQTVIEGTVEMAGHLGISVIAEGVECGADLQAIRHIGVPLAQGFALCRPMLADEFVRNFSDVHSWPATVQAGEDRDRWSVGQDCAGPVPELGGTA